MRGSYALLLLLSIGGLIYLDYRYRVAYFKHPDRTRRILAIVLAVFVLWDVLGIVANIFFIGHTTVLLGWQIGQFPIEEILFLMLLSYSSLMTYLLLKRRVN